MRKNIAELLKRHNKLERQIGLIDDSGRYEFDNFERYRNVIKHIKGEISELSEKDKELIEDDQNVLDEIIKIQSEITSILEKEA